MKKLIFIALAFVVALSLVGCGTPSNVNTSQPPNLEGTSDANTQEKDVDFEITYSNVKTYADSIGSTWVQAIVEISNTGTSNLYLGSASYDLETSDGTLLKSQNYVSTYPTVIAPGEKAYMYEETILDNPIEGELVLVPRISVKKATVDLIRYTLSDVQLTAESFMGIKALGRIENTSGKDESMISVVIILKDSNGTPVGVATTTIVETLAAGDKIGFEAHSFSLPDDVTVDSVASFEAFAYPMQIQF